MVRYYDKIQVNREIHINYNSYFYNYTVSDKFKQVFITRRLRALQGIRSYDYYLRLRELVLMSIYRFKRIFSFESNNSVIIVQDVMRDYIIKYYKDKNQDVEGTVDINFTKIYLDGDDKTYVYSVKELVDVVKNIKFDEITFETESGDKFTYMNTTLIDAVALRLSDIMFVWDDQIDASFKNYIHHYVDYYLQDSQISSLNLDPNYEYKIIDVLNNIDEYSFNSIKHNIFLDNITDIPKRNEDDEYSRIYYDILDIINGNDSDEIRQIIQTGYDISNFRLVNKKDKRPLLIAKILDDISNLMINTQVKYTISTTESSLVITVDDSGETTLNINYEPKNTKKILNKLPTLSEVAQRSKVDFLATLRTEVQRSIDHEIYQQYTSVINNIIDTVVIQNIDNALQTVSSNVSTTLDGVVQFLDEYKSSKLYEQLEQFVSDVCIKLQNIQDNIKSNFELSTQNNLGITIPFTIDLVRVFKKVIMKRLYLFESQLKHYVKYLEIGYYGLNFNKQYPQFVKMFFEILKPILVIDNQEGVNLTGVIQEIKEYLEDYLSEIMIGFYFEYLSEANLFVDEYITTPTYTNYSYQPPSKIDLMITTLIGNKSLIYPYQSLSIIQQQLSSRRILSLSSYKMLYFINLVDPNTKINFIKGRFNTKDSMMYRLLTDLNYEYDFTISETKLNSFSNDLSFYPDFIYSNEGIILFNFSAFLQDAYGLGYYLDYNLSQYLTKEILDKISDQLVSDRDYEKKIFVSNNIKPEYVVYTVYDVNEFIRSDKYLVRLNVIDVIRSLTYDYIISISHSFIFTDNFSPIRTKILEYLSIYKSLDDLMVLDYIDYTGRDFYSLSYNYRLYLTFEAIVNENITQEVSDYTIINTYNITELIKNIKQTSNQIPVIIKRILGL